MKQFRKLTESENRALLKFSAFISTLAANSDNKLDEAENKSAIKFSHIKTYSCDTLHAEFYKKADKAFENNVQQLDKDLPIKKQPGKLPVKGLTY